jgi:hypothetical protein
MAEKKKRAGPQDPLGPIGNSMDWLGKPKIPFAPYPMPDTFYLYWFMYHTDPRRKGEE